MLILQVWEGRRWVVFWGVFGGIDILYRLEMAENG
jgi:hypothetical protein